MPSLINQTAVLSHSSTEVFTLAPSDNLTEKKPAQLPELIAIQFPTSADGRGYSLARQVRRDWAFTGRLRAVGEIGLDQLPFLSRVGFDEFELPDTLDPAVALAYFTPFKAPYQASNDTPRSRVLDKLLAAA
jgi:uncharacterized protein (DUF934 family)